MVMTVMTEMTVMTDSASACASSCASEDSVSLSSDDVDHGQHEYDFRGDILNNRYAIFYKLGSGAYSTVWLAYDIDDGKFYAFKIQYSEDYDEGVDEVKFLRKIGTTPYITNLLEAFVVIRIDNEYICMKMDLCAGTLYDVIKTLRHTAQTTLSISMVQTITRQLCRGLAAIHQTGTIHADIKPENILLSGLSENVKQAIDTFTKMDFPKIYTDLRQKYIVDKQLNTAKDKHKKKLRKEKGNLYRAALQIIMLEINNTESEDDNTTYSLASSSSQSLSDVSCQSNQSHHSDHSATAKESDSDAEDDPQYNSIAQEYIDQCDIRITDFGTIVAVQDNQYDEIQTRHYRAPEVILGLKYTSTCDVWSMGCTLYELFTGKILFNPNKTDLISRDEYHLLDIYHSVGPFDKNMLKKSPRKKDFANINVTRTNVTPTLEDSVRQHYTAHHTAHHTEHHTENHTAQISRVDLFVDFLKQTLMVNGNKRPTVAELQNHAFLSLTNDNKVNQ